MKNIGSIIRISKNWILWLFFVILWNYGYPIASPLEDVIVAVLLSFFFILIKKKNQTKHSLVEIELPENTRGLQNFYQPSKTISDAGAKMGIHYDYKSTRNEKALKKEAKRKARIEQRRAKKVGHSNSNESEKKMHDIDKPITLEDLTNPDKE